MGIAKVLKTLCFMQVLLLSSIPLVAQVSPATGAIRGNVTDPTGAVVANATVVVVNSNFAFRREAKTESDGAYIFPFIPPGSGYQVDVTAPGFAQKEVKGIVVRVTEVTTEPIGLSLAKSTVNIEVTTAAETVNTTNATTGNTLPEAVIASLPLDTRNPLMLTATDAGVAADSDAPTLFAGGNRDTANNYSFNGIDSNNFEFNGLGNVATPDPDAVQEFRTQTSLFDASVGRNPGAYVALVSKSGTKQIHGTLYEFNRNQSMAAKNYFTTGPAAPFVQNNFGGSVGGPLPDKKTFWFFNYEGTRISEGYPITGPLPVLPSTRDAASIAAAFSLPQSAIDAVALAYLNLPGNFNGFLMPSGTGAPVGELGNFFISSPTKLSKYQMTARVDRDFNVFGKQNRLSFIMFHNPLTGTNAFGLGPGTGGTASQYLNDNYSLEDTYIFNPHLINNLTIGYTRDNIHLNNSVHPITLSQIGMSRFNSSLFAQAPWLGFSDQMSGYGTNAEAEPIQIPHTASLRETVTQTHNKHTLHYGFQAAVQAVNYHETYNFRGSLSFENIFADSLYNCPADGCGGLGDVSFRDFLIGAPVGISIASGLTASDYRANDMSAFFQDDFRASRRLTLNLGLRWDYFGNQYENTGHVSTFDPARVAPADAAVGGTGILAGFLIPSNIPQYGTPGIGKSTMYNQDKANFGPRVGFAYDVFGNAKLAVRGGYGIFFDRMAGMVLLQTTDQIPFGVTESENFIGTQVLSNPFPTLPLPSQFPVMPTPPQLTGIDPSTGCPLFANTAPCASPLFLGISAVNPHNHTPYTEEWNLTAQYQFAPSWSVELGYLGSHGQRLLNTLQGYDALLHNSNNPAAFGLVTNSAQDLAARETVVGIAPSSYEYVTNGASYYDGLLLTVQHQMAKGLFFKAAYTFSKSIDDAPHLFGYDVFGTPLGNPFLPALNKGLSDFDQRQRIVFTYLYSIPGPKKGALGYLLGGWSMSGMTTLNSGFPFTITQFSPGPSPVGTASLSGGSFPLNNFVPTSGFANVVPGCNPYTGGKLGGQSYPQFINSNCFTQTPILTGGDTFGPLSPLGGPGNQTYAISPNGIGQLEGNAGRNTLRGPFRQRWDFSLAKSFPIRRLGEGKAFELRGDFFQIFNHPVFSSPQPYNSTLGLLPSFGQINTTADIPREIQVSGRITF